jgi:glycosyltransferase involved in cell wall biosynthesis
MQVYLAALLKALGELTDGPEEYILLGPSQGSEWMEPLLGPNQTIVPLPQNLGLVRRGIRKVYRETVRFLSGSPLSRGGRGASRPCRYTGVGDVVQTSTGFIESLGVSLIHFPFQYCIITSLPSVFNPHDLQHLHLPRFFPPDVLMQRELLYPFQCRLATRVIVGSKWIAADLCEKYGLPREKVVVIPWGAPSSAYPAPTQGDIDRVLAKYGIGGKFIFYPAVAWPHKNHARLLEAVALLKQRGRPTRLVLSGGSTELTPRLQQLARERQLDDLVWFLGYVPCEEMRALFRSAVGVVIPTLFEAESGPMAEAWQEGVPVACSDLPPLREQAEEAALFFDPFSVEDIAGKIDLLLNDAPTREGLLAHAKERLDLYSWRTTAQRYREVYRSVACPSAVMQCPTWNLPNSNP